MACSVGNNFTSKWKIFKLTTGVWTLTSTVIVFGGVSGMGLNWVSSAVCWMSLLFKGTSSKMPSRSLPSSPSLSLDSSLSSLSVNQVKIHFSVEYFFTCTPSFQRKMWIVYKSYFVVMEPCQVLLWAYVFHNFFEALLVITAPAHFPLAAMQVVATL